MDNSDPPVLFDVDGVLAAFVGRILLFVNSKRDEFDKVKFTDITKDIVEYNFWQDEDLQKFVRSPEFCTSLPVLDEGFKACKILQNRGINIKFVTSPFYHGSPGWCHERTQWLQNHLGATRDDIIFARNKRYVHGITLIDDKPENVIEWQNYWKRPGLLFNQPQNYNLKNLIRVGTTENIVENVLHLKDRFDKCLNTF